MKSNETRHEAGKMISYDRQLNMKIVRNIVVLFVDCFADIQVKDEYKQ